MDILHILFDWLDQTEHLKHEVGAGEGGVAGGVIGGGDLHQVAAHNVETGAAPGNDKHDYDDEIISSSAHGLWLDGNDIDNDYLWLSPASGWWWGPIYLDDNKNDIMMMPPI